MERFPAELFQFDARMAEGWLSDRYFVWAVRTLEHAGRDPRVTMRVFAKRAGVVAGCYEAVRMLETRLTDGYTSADIEVETLIDGERRGPSLGRRRDRARARPARAHGPQEGTDKRVPKPEFRPANRTHA